MIKGSHLEWKFPFILYFFYFEPFPSPLVVHDVTCEGGGAGRVGEEGVGPVKLIAHSEVCDLHLRYLVSSLQDFD